MGWTWSQQWGSWIRLDQHSDACNLRANYQEYIGRSIYNHESYGCVDFRFNIADSQSNREPNRITDGSAEYPSNREPIRITSGRELTIKHQPNKQSYMLPYNQIPNEILQCRLRRDWTKLD